MGRIPNNQHGAVSNTRRKRQVVFSFIFLIFLAFTIVLNQNCSRHYDFFLLDQSKSDSSISSNVGGNPYEGKPSGEYVSLVPEHKCQNQLYPYALLNFIDGTPINMIMNLSQQCGLVTSPIFMEQMEISRTGKVVFYRELLFQQRFAPEMAVTSFVEYWCRSENLEVVGTWNSLRNVTQIQVIERNSQGQWQSYTVEVSEALNNNILYYSNNFPNETLTSLKIYMTPSFVPNEFVSEFQKNISDGSSQVLPLSCHLGYRKAPKALSPVSGANNLLMSPLGYKSVTTEVTSQMAGDFAASGSGEIFIISYSASLPQNQTVVTKLTANGDQVNSFGNKNNGNLLLMTSSPSMFNVIRIASNNSIYIAGNIDYQPAIMHLNQDGSANQNFAANGSLKFNSTTGTAGEVVDMQISPSGDIIALINSTINSTPQAFSLRRINVLGQIVKEFGINGQWVSKISARAVGLRAIDNGKNYIVAYQSSSSTFSVLKISENGIIDPSFGKEGFADIMIPNATTLTQFNYLEIGAHQIYLGGVNGGDLIVLALDFYGNKVKQFANDGIYTFPDWNSNYFQAMKVAKDQMIYIIGSTPNPSDGTTILKIDEAGHLITDFAGAGFRSLGSESPWTGRLIVHPITGELLLTGNSANAGFVLWSIIP